jgi:hypothetical protein
VMWWSGCNGVHRWYCQGNQKTLAMVCCVLRQRAFCCTAQRHRAQRAQMLAH